MSAKKILIVEDSPAIAEVVKRSLEKAGYHAVAVSNGFEALRDIETLQPDLIVTDINMPKLDGLKLCWALKNRVETKDIPFILLSSQFDEDTVAKGKELGAKAFIAKPFDAKIMVENVNKILG